MPGYSPASIRFFNPSPLGPPAISTKVGTQSRAANSWFLTVPGTPRRCSTSWRDAARYGARDGNLFDHTTPRRRALLVRAQDLSVGAIGRDAVNRGERIGRAHRAPPADQVSVVIVVRRFDQD